MPSNEPLTSKRRAVGLPPAYVFRQARVTFVPSTSPSTLAGGEGKAGTLTKIRISFDADACQICVSPAHPHEKVPVGAVNVTLARYAARSETGQHVARVESAFHDMISNHCERVPA